MGKNSNKRYDRSKDAITIKRFVNNYLGTDVECDNLRHIGLKSFDNPLVVGISNDFAKKNPDYVMTGEILLVIDAKGDLGAYINPNLLSALADKDRLEKTEKLLKNARLKDIQELSKLFKKISNIYQELAVIDQYEDFISEVGKEKAVQKIKNMKSISDTLYDEIDK